MNLSNTFIPETSTHVRFNQKKNTVTIFRQREKDSYELYNKGRWERYKDHINGIVPLTKELLSSKDVFAKKTKTPIKEIPKTKDQTYTPQVPTFKERVFETIPEPVLRQLVHYYENHDVVEVELNVKMTSVIKG
ncbi:hypothetical protein FDH01_gp249 [Acinetobacter phage vB_AbaM_ME3]|uniref:Uncharacterized protein n=1 Tax=Acinetobacter phage vB_AbaM_ME3 TaxID=1837876 RepID=A0A172Q0R0_9CAUD|nr:hypothetical protein FDH01_gp249 [Acinetobacter phage vB_AbaM_ME3]AND75373.1 hypothetical protein ME3_212 [Acinetobacter phage vB_AbaM_ME3]